MIQMFRDQLPRNLPCVVASRGDHIAIVVNSNYLGGDTAPMRDHVNLALRHIATTEPPRLKAVGAS